MSATAPLNPVHHQKVSSKRVLVVGAGYLGQRVGQFARQRGDEVWLTTRSTRKAENFSARGFQALKLDWNDRRTLRGLPEVDHLLVAVSYDRDSRLCRYVSQVQGLANLLVALRRDVSVCYISTTGVYHQTDGRWVDETSPSQPTREGGRAHLQAEQVLARQRRQSTWTVLRLAGIYGPGRVPRAGDVIAGRPIASPESGYLNLIHVDDAADAVLAAWDRLATDRLPDMDRSVARRLYLVADDQPVVRGDFYREIARQTGAPAPRFVNPSAAAAVSARSDSNKRIWNRRAKRDLLPQLRYPSYREGLADVLRDGVPDQSANT